MLPSQCYCNDSLSIQPSVGDNFTWLVTLIGFYGKEISVSEENEKP